MILLAPLIAALSLGPIQDGPELTAEEFTRVIDGAITPIHDVEAVFEGYTYQLDAGPDASGSRFSGLFASRRSGGAISISNYHVPERDGSIFTHRTSVLLSGEVSELEILPDFPAGRGVPERRPGSAQSLNRPESPLRFFFHWYLAAMTDPAAYGYEFGGWEEVDGHRCLKVSFDEVPGPLATRERPVIRLWIDLERGGNPLRIEYHRGSNLRMRTHGIRLAQFEPLGGGQLVWLPVYGETDNGDATSPTVHREVCYFLTETIRLNRDLPDSRFQVDWDGPLSYAPSVSQARGKFEAASRKRRSTPLGEAESLQERLDRELAEAESQSEMLRASSPSRRWFGPAQRFQLGLTIVGIATIGVALILRRRS